MISLQRSMHSSQMYTPGPAMSFLTCFWLLPQNEHFSRSPPSPIRATRSPSSGGPRLFARQRSTGPETIQRHRGAAVSGNPRAVRVSEVRRYGIHRSARLPTLEYLVHKTVLDRHRSGKDFVPLNVSSDLLDVPAGVKSDGVLEPGAHPQHLIGLDLDVRGLAVIATGHRRLVDQHPG